MPGESAGRFYIVFIIKILSIYVAWRLFEYVIGIESKPLEERFFPAASFYWEWLNSRLRIVLLHATALCLSLLGYDSIIENNYIITIPGYRGVGIGNYCLAFQFMFFFTCLILLSPLPVRVKLWSIPSGLLTIQALNVFRLVGIHLVIIYLPGWEEKLHDYFFNIAVLAVTLLIYMRLLSRYR